jgi:hypothetical protein
MDEKHAVEHGSNLVDALVQTLGLPDEPYWEPLENDDGKVRCRADVALFVERALSDSRGELAPVLIEFFIRRLESVVCWEVE